MDEDLIILVEDSLCCYRRAMFKAGKNLDIKAEVTRSAAIGLINCIRGVPMDSD